MKKLFLLFLLVFLLNPIFVYGGAWEQAQELCKQSGGNCNYNIPTPTPSIDQNYKSQSKPAKPNTYTKQKPSSLSPSQSLTIGIFGSFLNGLFGGLSNPIDNSKSYKNAQKQKEYEQKQKLLMEKKQKALNTWHAIKDNLQSQTQSQENDSAQNTPLGFKTLGSSLKPFKWQNKANSSELNNIALAQNQSQFDFNHEAQNFFSNRLNDLVQEGGKVFLEKYHKSNLLFAKSLKEQKKIESLAKFVGENAYENTIGVAGVIVEYKPDSLVKAAQSIADFAILKIGMPQANFTVETGKVYSRFVFRLLEKNLTDISSAVGMDFNFKEFINNSLSANQKGIYDWLNKE